MKRLNEFFKRLCSPRVQAGVGLIGTGYALGVASFVCVVWVHHSLVATDPHRDPNGFLPDIVSRMGGTPFPCPGIQQPPTTPAAEADLDDNESVIGVQAGGETRAYQVKALAKDPASHIVNDTVGSVPVTVTYCNVFNCARVFSGAGNEPLNVSQRGVTKHGMVIQVSGHVYLQDSGQALEADAPPFPYQTWDSKRTTWGEWRRAHPDSKVYLGIPNGG